jgi:hypothetical protein
MKRWFHPDRAEEFQNSAERIGAIDASVEESTEAGLRIRIARWSDRRGWEYSHRIETHLEPDGTASRTGDHFVAPRTDVVSYKLPGGRDMTKSCIGSIEFIPLATGSTKVSAFHVHSLVGGSWLLRRRLRRLDRSNTEAVFKDAIDHWPRVEASGPEAN